MHKQIILEGLKAPRRQYECKRLRDMTGKVSMSRTLCWFSCGAPSAVAAKLALADDPLAQVVYTFIKEEHPDNMRFLLDCERWLGVPIRSIGNDKYDYSIYEVFERERYIVGIKGAPCTKLLKRRVREEYQKPYDIHVMGYTIEEADRMEDFRMHYPELLISCPLIRHGLTKADCLAMVKDAGIALPAMYLLGFNNNNCVGCVKGGMGYWNKIRIHFPEQFWRMAKMERNIGHAVNRRDGKPVYLDELPEDAGRDLPEPRIECSIMCLLAKQEYSG